MFRLRTKGHGVFVTINILEPCNFCVVSLFLSDGDQNYDYFYLMLNSSPTSGVSVIRTGLWPNECWLAQCGTGSETTGSARCELGLMEV
jgi:hypothetical protein